VATSIGPADLLATPPEVFTAIEDLLIERAKQDKRTGLRDRLRSKKG